MENKQLKDEDDIMAVSYTHLSADKNPTISNTGIPSVTSASTRIGMLSMPRTIAVDTILYLSLIHILCILPLKEF